MDYSRYEYSTSNDRPILFPLPTSVWRIAQPRRLLFTAILLRRTGFKQIVDNNIIIIIFRILFIYLSNYVRISTKYIFYNSNRFIRPIYFLSIIITFWFLDNNRFYIICYCPASPFTTIWNTVTKLQYFRIITIQIRWLYFILTDDFYIINKTLKIICYCKPFTNNKIHPGENTLKI